MIALLNWFRCYFTRNGRKETAKNVFMWYLVVFSMTILLYPVYCWSKLLPMKYLTPELQKIT